jgi:alkylated DNA repair dioxygenase AlkB
MVGSIRSAPAPDLFPGESPLPAGFAYEPAFLSVEEERGLLARIGALELKEAAYKVYTAKRRIAMLEPIPVFFDALRARIARWRGIAPEEFVHALVTEYRPGTRLGWHRDSPEYGSLAGVSLLGAACMKLRRYPPRKGEKVFDLDLPPRSAYALQDEARWGWQHSIAPAAELRYSITFRTLRTAS